MSLLTQPQELQANQPLSCLIYGQPGTGKTTLALSASNPVLIDLDRGLHRVEKRFQKPSLQVENYQQILDLLNSTEINGFDTIVIDTFGKLVDRIGDYVCTLEPKYRKKDGGLAMQGWGAVKVQFQNLMKIVFNKNKTIIFVAHEKEDKDGDIRFVRPDASGSAGKDLVKELDLMGYLEMKGAERTLSFSPDEKKYAKNSLNLPPVIKITDTAKGNTFFQDVIVKAVTERNEAENETNEKYNSLKKTIDSKVSAIKDIESLNRIYKELGELPIIWDTQIYWRHQLKAKADELKATFNTETKAFEG